LNKSAWQLNGKIAFIQQLQNKSKRESASLIWQVNERQHTQELNLTSYLGINVLHLKSNNQKHLIKVDGKEYRGTHLSSLIYSLTGLTLPTQALNLWLKGLPYKADDKLQLNETTQLPTSISSYYNNELWQITYANYKYFNNINMATQFTIEKDNLLIKIAVKNWHFID
jgi:outer membrane lipoprotein LolB